MDPSPDPSLLFVLLGQGSGHSGMEGEEDGQTTARASNSFCLKLDSSVLAVGKWFSIESIIFFFFKYIFVKVIPFCFSGKSASAHSQ